MSLGFPNLSVAGNRLGPIVIRFPDSDVEDEYLGDVLTNVD